MEQKPMNNAEITDESIEEQMTEYMEFVESDSNDDDEDTTTTPYKAYVSKETQYNENKSTGFTFIFVGILGLIFAILNFTRVLRVIMEPEANYFIYAVMAIFFSAFVIYGIVSYVKSHKMSSEVQEELSLTKTILSNFTLTPEDIDVHVDPNTPVELKYFERIVIIKSALQTTYPEIQEDYLDDLSEQLYTQLFTDSE